MPFSFIRDLTIPCVEIKRWNRIYFTILPFFSALFLLFVFGKYSFIIEKFYLIRYNNKFTIIGIIILLIIASFNYVVSYRNRLPKFISVFSFFSFVMSIIWIWFIAKILISMLDLIGLLIDVPDTFLALTLLGLGNSLPDLVLNINLTKAGYGEMGLAGSIAGPLFNFIFGLGAALIKRALMDESITLKLFYKTHMIILFAIGIQILNLARLLIQSFYYKFKLNKCVSLVGYLIYVVFLIVIFILAFI